MGTVKTAAIRRRYSCGLQLTNPPPRDRNVTIPDTFYKDLLDNLYDGVYLVDTDGRITYWNRGAERLSGFSASDAIGKHCSEHLLRHIGDQGRTLCEGRCPVTATMADGKSREADVHLHHKDGHLVPVSIRVNAIRGTNGQIVGAVEIFSDNTTRVIHRKRTAILERMAYLDPLTGLANRRYVEVRLRTRFDEMTRYGWVFGLLFIDIDHFKPVNDTYGHDVGDEVLKMVANTLSNSSRPSDFVARWGGEEFLVVAVNVQEKKLRAIAERLRVLVGQSSITKESETIQVTVTIGGTLSRLDDSVDTLLKRADALMYEGKKAGRNRVVVRP